MMTCRILFARLTLVFALTFAMASAGFAHRYVQSGQDDMLEAYLAAGGSLSDVCGDLDALIGQGCDACRLVDTASVAGAGTLRPIPNIRSASAGLLNKDAAILGHPFDPIRAPRAPPAI